MYEYIGMKKNCLKIFSKLTQFKVNYKIIDNAADAPINNK